jgi:DNA-binding transcriptional ArsR family regulator
MREQMAIAAIRAFSSRARVTIFRGLIRADPKRVTVEDLASAVGFSEAAVEQHMNQFEQAGLVCSGHDGQTIGYTIDHHGASELWGFLLAHCCPGNFDQGRAVTCS